jgi:hypothetical protein
MKYLSLVPIAFFSLALQAQTAGTSAASIAAANANAAVSHDAVQSGTSAQSGAAGQTISRAGQAALSSSSAASTNVSAELTKKIDTKNAKVGDAVQARTTSAAKLADGTKLPRGTKLLGRVTDTHARSSADQTSHLAFTLDRAVLRDGSEIPVHAVLTSVTGRAMASASAGDDMPMPSGAAMAGGGASGGGRGGMLGGAGRTAGGVVGGATNTVGNAGGAVQSETGLVGQGGVTGTSIANGGGSSVALDHVPVANLAGVTISSATSSSSSGSLDAAGRNISLESGTQMTLNVSASQQ